jgi:hypothetical protein
VPVSLPEMINEPSVVCVPTVWLAAYAGAREALAGG